MYHTANVSGGTLTTLALSSPNLPHVSYSKCKWRDSHNTGIIKHYPAPCIIEQMQVEGLPQHWHYQALPCPMYHRANASGETLTTLALSSTTLPHVSQSKCKWRDSHNTGIIKHYPAPCIIEQMQVERLSQHWHYQALPCPMYHRANVSGGTLTTLALSSPTLPHVSYSKCKWRDSHNTGIIKHYPAPCIIEQMQVERLSQHWHYQALPCPMYHTANVSGGTLTTLALSSTTLPHVSQSKCKWRDSHNTGIIKPYPVPCIIQQMQVEGLSQHWHYQALPCPMYHTAQLGMASMQTATQNVILLTECLKARTMQQGTQGEGKYYSDPLNRGWGSTTVTL